MPSTLADVPDNRPAHVPDLVADIATVKSSVQFSGGCAPSRKPAALDSGSRQRAVPPRPRPGSGGARAPDPRLRARRALVLINLQRARLAAGFSVHASLTATAPLLIFVPGLQRKGRETHS
jgi:hypothetical protein